MSREIVRYKPAGGSEGAVVAVKGPKGRIYTPMVWIDVPLRLYRIPNGDVELHGVALPDVKVRHAAREMLRVGKQLGITKGAKKFLRSCL